MVLPIAAITKFNDKHSVTKRHSNALTDQPKLSLPKIFFPDI
jgi:hypothetical protein